MRIITGKARGTTLKTLPGTDTRPTTEICKEGVFSAIQFELHGRNVLDLFGGSGQMALEALSRGAERATVVDNSRAACEIRRANAVKTKLMEQCRVVCSDWKDFVKTASGKEKFDLVFLDPPYNDGVLEGVLKKLKALDLLAPGAIIVAESAQTGVPVPDDSWSARVYRYGKTFVMIMRLPEQAAAGEESV